MYKKSIIGYSGHEINLSSSVAAVVLGQKLLKFTLQTTKKTKNLEITPYHLIRKV